TDLSRMPPGLTEDLALATATNRGVAHALRFALAQPRTPTTDLVAGELLAAAGNIPQAMERLRAAAASKGDTAERAACSFARTAMVGGQPQAAWQVLNAHPQLVNGRGRVLLARCAAEDGRLDLADRLYADVEDDSPEAREYMVRRAVDGGD